MTKKYYVVWEGKKKGIFHSWNECQKSIQGFSGAKYKSFPSLAMAKEALSKPYTEYYGKKVFKAQISEKELEKIGKYEENSLSVDAACNMKTRIMEFQAVNTKTKEEEFYLGPFEDGTNNIGEFLALYYGIRYLLKNPSKGKIIYSDSVTAMKWVRDAFANTKAQRTEKNKELFKMIDQAENWLKNNQHDIEVRKWQTKYWGEIPADFGRK